MLEVGAAIGATLLSGSGDSADFAVVAERMAQMCDLARDYNIAVDIEFMPFRPVKTFTDALGVVRRADRPNAHIMVDALHVFRSNSSLDDIRKADRRFLGTFQICDAPRDPPPADQLATEARTRRLLPGHGGLPLWELIDALPADIPSVELPIASQFPKLDPQARMQLMARSTREFYASRRKPWANQSC
jgi:sugar phosphate isomerase/epimerase